VSVCSNMIVPKVHRLSDWIPQQGLVSRLNSPNARLLASKSRSIWVISWSHASEWQISRHTDFLQSSYASRSECVECMYILHLSAFLQYITRISTHVPLPMPQYVRFRPSTIHWGELNVPWYYHFLSIIQFKAELRAVREYIYLPVRRLGLRFWIKI
jgi:hypothetical protein